MCSIRLVIKTLGSPPHPRGIYFDRIKQHETYRFTPASAGNICRTVYSRYHHKVHPRIRGEYPLPQQPPYPVMGSPPHPRGISTDTTPEGASSRFTPASAGNMSIFISIRTGLKVHPRIRGEYSCEYLRAGRLKGSPPHPRGISIQGKRPDLSVRFTPASAGNIGH